MKSHFYFSHGSTFLFKLRSVLAEVLRPVTQDLAKALVYEDTDGPQDPPAAETRARWGGSNLARSIAAPLSPGG